MLNRKRRETSHNQDRIESALQRLSQQMDFRLGAGLHERVAYRELVLLGLTQLDLHRSPDLARTKTVAAGELLQLLDDLGIAQEPGGLLPQAGHLAPRPAYSSHLG
jgi:chromosome partitioning protein